MYKELFQAMIGKIYGKILCRRYQGDKYVFFPENKEEYIKWGIELLPRYMIQNQLEKIVIIATDNSVEKRIIDKGIAKFEFKKVTDKSMECFMDYYALKDMSNQWVVVSTTQPYDTGAERLLGIKGVTCRDIVYYDIYGFDGEMT